jgi:hypothetical protein
VVADEYLAALDAFRIAPCVGLAFVVKGFFPLLDGHQHRHGQLLGNPPQGVVARAHIAVFLGQQFQYAVAFGNFDVLFQQSNELG